MKCKTKSNKEQEIDDITLYIMLAETFIKENERSEQAKKKFEKVIEYCKMINPKEADNKYIDLAIRKLLERAQNEYRSDTTDYKEIVDLLKISVDKGVIEETLLPMAQERIFMFDGRFIRGRENINKEKELIKGIFKLSRLKKGCDYL